MSDGQAAKKISTFEVCLGCPTSQDSPCEVENLVNGVLFVRAAHAFLCYHKTSFGDSYICRCPARREVYQRHGR